MFLFLKMTLMIEIAGLLRVVWSRQFVLPFVLTFVLTSSAAVKGTPTIGWCSND